MIFGSCGVENHDVTSPQDAEPYPAAARELAVVPAQSCAGDGPVGRWQTGVRVSARGRRATDGREVRLARRPDAPPTPAGRMGGFLVCTGALMEIGLASLVPR